MELLITQFSPVSCPFHPLRSHCQPHHSILQYPHPLPFMRETKFHTRTNQLVLIAVAVIIGYRLTGTYRRFGECFCHLILVAERMVNNAYSFRTWAPVHQTTRRHIPDTRDIYIYCHQNLTYIMNEGSGLPFYR